MSKYQIMRQEDRKSDKNTEVRDCGNRAREDKRSVEVKQRVKVRKMRAGEENSLPTGFHP